MQTERMCKGSYDSRRRDINFRYPVYTIKLSNNNLHVHVCL